MTINEELDPNQLIRRLKSEILTLREEITFLKTDPSNSNDEEPLTPLALEELKVKIKEYCSDRDLSRPLNIG